MNLRSGERLGPYEIVAPIGAGGMGEVYKARDTRLGRDVAIKILPAEFSNDANRKIRFDREAKAISALNHPHICTLHDVGSDSGVHYLVMEHCEGQTIAHRLERGPLPIERILEYGSQIAEALDRAHRAGVIHRDIKPANVILTKSGVKLLDFGLARRDLYVVGTEGSSSGTVERALTDDGLIVGTIQYMAPETLTSGQSDARSDIFAIGLVLYEMATAKRAFPGSNKASVIAAILDRHPPPPSEMNASLPSALDDVVRGCLAKDPEQRIQNAHDVALQLEWIARRIGADGGPSVRVATKQWQRILLTIAAATALASAAYWAARPGSGSGNELAHRRGVLRAVIDLRDSAPLALAHLPPAIGFFSPVVSISHDGNQIVYVGVAGDGTQLFKRSLDTFATQAIPGTRDARYAFFSPDDRWIGFLTGDKVMKIAAAGGSAVTLANADTPVRARWGLNGVITVFDRLGFHVLQIPQDGGPATSVKLLERFPGIVFSDVLPDGHTLLGDKLRSSVSSRIVLIDPGSRAEVPLLNDGYDARFVEPGILTFAREGDLHAVRFDAKNRRVDGEPVTIQAGVATDSFFSQTHYAVSETGVVAFVPGLDRAVGRPAWLDLNGSTQFLDLPAGAYRVFEVSPDGQQVALEVADINTYILILDLKRKEARRLPVDGDVWSPIWTDDGDLIFTSAAKPAGSQVRKASTSGANVKVLYTSPHQPVFPMAASRDGNTLLISATVYGRSGVDVITGGALSGHVDLAATSDISPDGRWIAYTSPRTGRREIWLRSAAHSREAYQISVDGGHEPRWCRRCPDLFYRKGSKWYAVEVSTKGPLKWKTSRAMWETDFIDTPGRSYDVSPDGKRLLVIKHTAPTQTDRIQLIENWQTLLR